MVDIATTLNVNNEVFGAYVFWASVLAIKMLCMSFLTAAQRFRKKAVANPEDARGNPENVTFGDPDVERVRRAHRNDMENILPFFTVGFLYMFVEPNVIAAVNLYRVVAIARIIHTIVYAVWVVPQPARALAFFTTLGITLYMSVHCMVYFIKFI